MFKVLPFLLGLLFLSFFFFSPKNVFAEGEFATSYNVSYDVLETGDTDVSETITLKNLTDKFYPSHFSLTIASKNISNLSASDSQGFLPIKTTDLGQKTQVDVSFNNQQIIGKGKEYKWTLQFNSKDFSSHLGSIWQVNIPKVKDSKDIDNYDLVLRVPVGFGDPNTIIPAPGRFTESEGKINFFYSKSQVLNQGILASFGTEQLMDFDLTYSAINTRFIPSLVIVPLPKNNSYQDITINSIVPEPENVVLDEEGNINALFNINRKQNLQIAVKGRAKIHPRLPGKVEQLTKDETDRYTRSTKYWDKDNPQIQAKLGDIFKQKIPNTNFEKAFLIHKYVVDALRFDTTRYSLGDIKRLGGLAALTNPDKAQASEFTDLFISLARAAHLPSRQVIGYAYSSNNDTRPSSYRGKVLHTWPEFFDPSMGWVMIDPTWENTSGGIDYFSNSDFNHLAIASIGEPSSTDQYNVLDAKASFSDAKFDQKNDLVLSIESPPKIFAGLPSKIKVRVENRGNVTYPADVLAISAKNVKLIPSKSINGDKATSPSDFFSVGNNTSYNFAAIPPFGHVEYELDLRTSQPWDQFGDTITASVGKKSVTQEIKISSIFSYYYLLLLIIFIIVIFVISYIFTLTLHLKANKKDQKSV